MTSPWRGTKRQFHALDHTTNTHKFHLNLYYLPLRRRPRTGDIETPPSACLAVTFSFRTVTRKHIAVFSRNFAGNNLLILMGCCLNFFVNKNKNKFYEFCFSHFMFSSRFVLFPTFLEQTCNLFYFFVVLASEPVSGRSRATELPCFFAVHAAKIQ